MDSVRSNLLFLLAGAVFVQIAFAACPDTVHRYVKGFGPGCKYRCNCVNNEQCDNVTGECSSGCLRGWMGPACQYRNYASGQTVTASQSDLAASEAIKVIDGDVNTCSRTGSVRETEEKQQWWSAQFRTALYIVGLVIKVPESETVTFRGFTVKVGYKTGASTLCYEHGTDGESVMEINCVQPVAGDVLKISFAENVNSSLVLCEVEVYGGRLVSFNMPTQSKTVTEYPSNSFWNSSYAVDGKQMFRDEDQDKTTERTCTAIGDDKKVDTQWWSVKLEAVFNIQGFNFFGRLKSTDQYTSFSVISSYSNQNNELFNDSQPSDVVDDYNPKAKHLTSPVLGKIVRVERRARKILAICEFEVFAECPLGKCGWDCNITCVCKRQTTGLKKIEGTCPYGCSGRWTGSHGRCDIECSNTTWGPDCKKTCGHCKNDLSCSVSDGTCPESCTPGWYPPYCAEACDAGRYGINCSNKCGRCKHGQPCNHTNGQCLNGCHSGWLTEFCNKSCDNGFYGEDCTTTCGYCWGNSSCNHEDGACSRCAAGYQGNTCKTEITHKDGISTEAVVGAVFGVLAAVGILVAVFVTLKRKSNRHSQPKPEQVQANFVGTDIQSTTNKHVQSTQPITSSVQEAVYSNVSSDHTTEGNTIKVSHLRAYIQTALTDPASLFTAFKNIPYGITDDCSEARDLQYKPKNRYKDLYPYNKNRVILPEIPGDPLSTYINASYINGYDTPRKYTAAQGALKSTVSDIWRMVWYEKIFVIVMLTNCIELGKFKCVQYWSNEGSKVYADISTDLVSVEEYADFKIRTFHCELIGSAERRTVLQFHYTAWPDKDVPDTALSLVQFWQKIKGHSKATRFPWLVHCSAGVGRTGTFIALDYLFDQGKSEGAVNIKDCVHTLRSQRLNMVQTKHQYVYLHEAVVEALVPIGTVCDCQQFIAMCRTLFTKDGLPTKALRDEYELLSQSTILLETVESIYCNDTTPSKRVSDASLPENANKSRNLNIIPDDLHRPRLGMAVKGRNDFINAVYVPTYRQKDRLIITQFPLSETTTDFLRMIWEFDIDRIVLLEGTVPGDGVYWPSKEVPKIITPFTSEHVGETKKTYYTIRTVRYTYGESEQTKDVRIFHLQSWSFSESAPADTASLLELICDIENDNNENKPLIIQCIDGAEKSGLFSVLFHVLERIKTDREVAIAETIRQLRLRRKQAIKNFEQYAYCYKIVRDYLESHEVYANVM